MTVGPQTITPMETTGPAAPVIAAVAALGDADEARSTGALFGALAAAGEAYDANPDVRAERIALADAADRARVTALAAELSSDPSAARQIVAIAEAAERRHTGRVAPVRLNLDDLPEPDRWLLRHPTCDGAECPPGRGDGLLPRGIAGLLVSDGGIGKTGQLIILAMCVATGRPWFGHFEVDWGARGDRVLLALAEEDETTARRRMYYAAQFLGLTADEKRRAEERIDVLPLLGLPVGLDAPEGDTGETETIATLRRRLDDGAQGQRWALVAIDPLAHWAPQEVEVDNTEATRAMRLITTLTRAPGNPTVIVAHHVAASAVNGERQIRARGVTGLRNAARWEAALRAGQDGLVYFRQTKSNYSRSMADELPLSRIGTIGLRAASAEERAMRVDAADEARRAAAEQKVRERKAVAAKVAAEADETTARKLAGAATAAPMSARDLEHVAGLAHGAPATRALMLASARGWIRAEGTGHRGAPTWVRGVTP